MLTKTSLASLFNRFSIRRNFPRGCFLAKDEEKFHSARKIPPSGLNRHYFPTLSTQDATSEYAARALFLWALSINTARSVRTVKLLNETQNVWSSDLSDRKSFRNINQIFPLKTGTKLVPFNSGGVCQNCPAKTDDALQQIFISGHYFPQKCGKFFSGHYKKGHKIFPDINQLNYGSKNISVQIPVKTWVKFFFLWTNICEI